MVPPRRLTRPGWLVLAALPLALQISGEAQQAAPSAAQSADYFEAKVRPVLAANCYECHTDQRMGGLRVDSREGLLKGGKSGPAIVPGDPDKSLMIQAIRQTDKLKMPKGGGLKLEEIDALTEWVKAGAVWPTFAGSVTSDSPASVGKPTVGGSVTSDSPASMGKPAVAASVTSDSPA